MVNRVAASAGDDAGEIGTVTGTVVLVVVVDVGAGDADEWSAIVDGSELHANSTRTPIVTAARRIIEST